MSKVQELEIQLKVAKEAEKRKTVNKHLDWMREHGDTGKSYATHSFTRRWKTIDAMLIKVGEPIYEEGSYCEYQYECEKIIFIDKTNKVNEIHNDSFLVQVSTSRLNSNWLSGQFHEIPNSLFDDIKRRVTATGQIFMTEILQSVKEHESMTQGEYADRRTAKTWMDEVGIPFVEITNKHHLQLLTWMNHPLIVDDRLLLTEYTKPIIMKKIDKLIENAGIWGGKVAERDLNHVKEFKNIINTYL